MNSLAPERGVRFAAAVFAVLHRSAAYLARRRSDGVGGCVSAPCVFDGGSAFVRGPGGDRRRWQDAARQLRRLQRPQGRAYVVGVAAGRSDRAWPSDGRREEQRNPRRAGADRGAGDGGLPVHARRRALSKKPYCLPTILSVYGIGTVRTPAQVRRGIMAARSYLRLKRYWYSAR